MAIILERTPSLTDALYAADLISSLDEYYPDIKHWYLNTVLTGIFTGDDRMIIAKEGNMMVGLALGKKTEECKLRCIRVLPSYQNTGLGMRLIDSMIDELECEKPHATVSEEMINLYSRPFINRYGFELHAVNKGMYRKGKLEYIFN